MKPIYKNIVLAIVLPFICLGLAKIDIVELKKDSKYIQESYGDRNEKLIITTAKELKKHKTKEENYLNLTMEIIPSDGSAKETYYTYYDENAKTPAVLYVFDQEFHGDIDDMPMQMATFYADKGDDKVLEGRIRFGSTSENEIKASLKETP